MLVDDILQRLSSGAQVRLREALRDAVVVKAQNIADYFYLGTGQEEWEPEVDFPNCAPPWPTTWIEWRHPAFSRSDRFGLVPQGDMGNSPVGVLVEAERPGKEFPKDVLDADGAVRISGHVIRWRLTFAPYFAYLPLPALGVFTMLIDEAGICFRLPLADGTRLDPCGVNPRLMAMSPLEPNVAADHIRQIGQGVARYIPLLTFCFCHCTNVVASETIVPPALVRARAQRNRAPVSRFYTLNITPFRKASSAAAPGSDPDAKRALHLCRGHFKDFRGAKGLFGKYHGMYWWAMQARGDPAQGEIRKDYNVRPE